MIADDTLDMIIVTEVIPKAQKHPILEPLLNISGFEKFTNFKFTESDLGASGKRGVAIFVNNELDAEVIDFETKYDDHLWVQVKLRNRDSLLCGCIYRTPNKDSEKVAETTKAVCDLITEAISKKNTHLLICGDFNYPEIDWSCEYTQLENVKPFIDTIQEFHLHQHVCKPTRYREGQKPSLLDLILSTEEGMVHNLMHYPPLGDSDHDCLRFELNCYKEDVEEMLQPNYYKARYEIIRERLKDVDWIPMLRGKFLDSYYLFETVLTDAMTGCVPDKRKGKKKKNMYMTLDAIQMKDRKNKLWRRYKKSGLEYDLTKFRQVKNQLRSLTRRLRRAFESDIARDAKRFPKKFWSYVKSRTKTRSRIPILRRENGTTASTSKEKAETLNEFFSSVFTDEQLDNIPEERHEFLGNYLRTFVISQERVEAKLAELNPSKTPGPDKWHPLLLRSIADLIS